MTYRIRMVYGSWWVMTFDKRGRDALTLGPYRTIAEAESVAAETGYRDRDRG